MYTETNRHQLDLNSFNYKLCIKAVSHWEPLLLSPTQTHTALNSGTQSLTEKDKAILMNILYCKWKELSERATDKWWHGSEIEEIIALVIFQHTLFNSELQKNAHFLFWRIYPSRGNTICPTKVFIHVLKGVWALKCVFGWTLPADVSH